MTKWLTTIALTLTLATAGTAAADDAAKIQACEKVKAGVSKQQDKCPDQAAAAAKLTCTADTAPQMKTLFEACLKAVTKKPAAGSKVVSCKGLDEGGAVIAETTGETTSKCGKALTPLLTDKLCAGLTASKAVKYQFVRDNGKPVKSSLYCRKPKASR
jgi:hypothetical protein